jgi:phage terminase large subunit
MRTFGLVLILLALSMVDVDAAARARLASYRETPHGACKFALEQFGFQPDPWQEETLVAFADPTKQRISLQACAGPGKTAVVAVCAWYFLATQVSGSPGAWDYPKGLATSITGDNLRDNLWAELAHWQGRSEWLRQSFVWTSSRVFQRSNQANWFLAARAWPKSGNADEQGRTFSGLHGKNVAIFVDESGAIPGTIMRAGEQALPNTRFGKLMQAGNPISHKGMLYEAANLRRHLWHIVRVTGDPDDPKAWVHSPRVANVAAGQKSPADDAREQIATYGRHNPWVMAYILGQFPPQSINSLLSLEEVLAAQAREPRPDVYAHMQKRLGVDVARFGDDRTVLFPRQGAMSHKPHEMRGADTNQIVARILMAKERWGSELELIDNSFAWGNGVIDNLRHVGQQPHAVDFGGRAIDPRYHNRRAEMWLRMADHIKSVLALPDVPGLVSELTTPTYTFHTDGTFLLESKDQVKKRLERSPDLADALALTYALPDAPGGMRAFTAGASANHAATEYDPYVQG